MERGCYLHVLEKLFRLGVVDGLDVLIVDEIFLLRHVGVDLEALLVEGILGLVASDIGDLDGVRIYGALVRLGPAHVGRRRRRPILIVFVVVEHRFHLAW